MNKKNQIIVGLIALVIIIIAGYVFSNNSKTAVQEDPLANQATSTEEPFDIVFDFYGPWLEAVQRVETTPYQEGLQNNAILSERLRQRLQSSEGSEMDPVLCQSTVPERFTAKQIAEYEDMTRILVRAKDKTLTAQATFNIKKLGDAWFIDDIICDLGEFAPDVEFTFEQEGFLLKDVPEPLNSEYWHIIFEKDGTMGHYVPLFFDAESICVSSDGTESTCAPDQFTQASRIRAYAQMTELGAEVDKMEFVE